jgi:small subunit ribosomal protein S18
MAKARMKAKSFRPRRKRVCYFCAHPESTIDYKGTELMKKYTTDRGKITPRRRSGCCPKHQREMARSIKRGRVAGLMAYYID